MKWQRESVRPAHDGDPQTRGPRAELPDAEKVRRRSFCPVSDCVAAPRLPRLSEGRQVSREDVCKTEETSPLTASQSGSSGLSWGEPVRPSQIWAAPPALSPPESSCPRLGGRGVSVFTGQEWPKDPMDGLTWPLLCGVEWDPILLRT